MRHIVDIEQDFVVRDVADDQHRLAPGFDILCTLRDLTVIALAWALLIGVILYPAAQLVGLLTCAIALWAASRRGRSATADEPAS